MDSPVQHKEHGAHGHQGHAQVDASRRRGKWVFIAFALIAAFFLVTEHRAHLLGVLPFLLLLACPLLHLFHHGGHGGHDSESKEGDGK
ncbi:DUF2933 domain-containing protein [Aromatoleum evansii]|uniref:DUF2933 domain-containing protein n=1 Tax=Aromatoleum evansii TaxID=59406 RepID=UPI00145D4CB5|nr:DUF2933 domain-containing protein [Aromatoleum evansii]